MFGRKGMSMAIKLLIVIIVAVLVLATVIAIFTGTVPVGGQQMECSTNIRARCMNITRQKGSCEENAPNSMKDISGCQGKINLTEQCCL